MSMVAKKALSFDDIEAQTAVELPDRESMLVTIVITDVLNDLDITITVQDVNVAAVVCANVLASNSNVTCEVTQR